MHQQIKGEAAVPGTWIYQHSTSAGQKKQNKGKSNPEHHL